MTPPNVAPHPTTAQPKVQQLQQPKIQQEQQPKVQQPKVQQVQQPKIQQVQPSKVHQVQQPKVQQPKTQPVQKPQIQQVMQPKVRQDHKPQMQQVQVPKSLAVTPVGGVQHNKDQSRTSLQVKEQVQLQEKSPETKRQCEKVPEKGQEKEKVQGKDIVQEKVREKEKVLEKGQKEAEGDGSLVREIARLRASVVTEQWKSLDMCKVVDYLEKAKEELEKKLSKDLMESMASLAKMIDNVKRLNNTKLKAEEKLADIESENLKLKESNVIKTRIATETIEKLEANMKTLEDEKEISETRSIELESHFSDMSEDVEDAKKKLTEMEEDCAEAMSKYKELQEQKLDAVKKFQVVEKEKEGAEKARKEAEIKVQEAGKKMEELKKTHKEEIER